MPGSRTTPTCPSRTAARSCAAAGVPTGDRALALEEAIHQRAAGARVAGHPGPQLGWTRHFGPASGSDPKIRDAMARYVLTVFANGTLLGPAHAGGTVPRRHHRRPRRRPPPRRAGRGSASLEEGFLMATTRWVRHVVPVVVEIDCDAVGG